MEWIAPASPANIPIGSWDTRQLSELHQPGRSSYQGDPQLGGDRIVQALELLKELNILHYRRLELTNHNNQPFSRFLIFAVDSIAGYSSTVSGLDRNRNQGRSLPANQSKAALETVLLNMNVDPWIFQHESEAAAPSYCPTTFSQDDKTKRLIDIYLDMPSPRGSDDPFMKSDIRTPSKAAARLLQNALERNSPKGMRTTLYDYQRKSLWKLLRRELCPDIMIDPTLIPVQDMNGGMYYINTANGSLTIGRHPSSTWDDAPGGIICEDMVRTFSILFFFGRIDAGLCDSGLTSLPLSICTLWVVGVTLTCVQTGDRKVMFMYRIDHADFVPVQPSSEYQYATPLRHGLSS